MRVVRANVALSALVFREGRVGRLRAAWQSGRIVPLASRATAEELVRVLAYPKFRLEQAEQEDLLADYLPFCRAIREPRRAIVAPAAVDQDDVAFVRLAIAGRADALVTGDKALQRLDGSVAFRVLSPAALLDLLPAE